MKNIVPILFILLYLPSFAQPTQTNIAYGSHPQQKLDYYAATSPGSPVILAIHGGGWKSGDKSEAPAQNICQLFKNAGYAVVNINYRLDTDGSYSGHPAIPSDVACALAWTKLNASTFNGDSSKVVLYGHSAGGHLSVYHGLNSNPSLLAGCGFNGSLNVKACISTSGVYDFDLANPNRRPDINAMLGDSALYWKAAQPMTHVANNTTTKFLLIHGQGDGFVGQQQAIAFNDSMLAHDQCCRFIYLAGLSHNQVIQNLTPTDTVFRSMVTFLDSLWQNQLCPTATAISEMNEEMEVVVYTNPEHNNILLHIKNGYLSNCQLVVYDGLGKTVQTKNIDSPFVKIEKYDLKKGVYFYTILDKNRSHFNSKFVVLD